MTTTMNKIEFVQVATPSQITDARVLFLEYAESLGFSLCFQSFDKELAGLPGDYAPPSGRLLLAFADDKLAGCVALHRIGKGAEVCEMKRLYVRKGFRGHRLGQRLLDRLVEEARAIGYKKIRLDTVTGKMDTAIALYRANGFVEIAPYCANPIPGALYMELQL